MCCAPHSWCPNPHFQGPHISVIFACNTASHLRFPCAPEHSVSVWFACSQPVFNLVTPSLLSSRFQSSSSVRSVAPVFSLDAHAPELLVLVWFQCVLRSSCFQSGPAHVPGLMVSVCFLAGAGPRVWSAPQCRRLLLPGAQAWQLLPPSIYLPTSMRGFTASRFIP